MSILSFLGRLFDSQATINSTIDTVSNAVDKFVYTDKEKTDDQIKEKTQAYNFILNRLALTQGQNLTRRFLAVGFAGIQMLEILLALIFNILSFLFPHYSPFLEIYNRIEKDASSLSLEVGLILSFYFAIPHVGSMINSFKKNKDS